MVGLPAIAEGLSSETLVGLGLDGRPVPRLADHWTASTDGRELRLTLPPELKLHDGRKANATIIGALLKKEIEDADNLQMHARLKGFFEIVAKDDSTLVLRSRSPRILALEELANITLKTGSPDGGLGPFVVDSLTNEGIQLHGFEDYFKGAPAISRVKFQVYRSQRAAWTGVMRGEADAMYEVSREAVEFVEQQSRLRTRSFLRPYVSGLLFNVSRPQFRDPQVRVALAAAIDRARIVNSVYRGRARVAEGPLTPTYWALSRDVQPTRFDPEKATALLSRFTFTSRPGEMPARLRFRCLVPTFETQPFERTALLIQKQLYGFGVDVQLEPISLRDLLPRLASGNFDTVLMEFVAVTPSWLSYFWHSPAAGATVLVNGGYSAADEELEALDGAANEQELRRSLSAVYRKMAKDPPAVFIAWPEVTRAVARTFDVPVEDGRDIMGANLRFWRPAAQR